MFKNTSFIAFILSLAALAPSAFASELDQEGSVTNVEQQRLAANLPATIVVRVDQRDQSVAVLHSQAALPVGIDAKVLAEDSNFSPMSVDQTVRGELDRDSSASSWYFSFNNYNCYAPTYYYYGYYYRYQPYYKYTYNYFHYYFYRW